MTILDDFPTPVKRSRVPRGVEPWQRLRPLSPGERYPDPTPFEDRGPATDDLVRGCLAGHPAAE